MSSRKIIPALLVLFGIIIFSCNKEKPENRLIGTWRIDKVTFRKKLSLSKTDLTDVYSGIQLSFFSDKTFLYHHPGRKVDLTGYWEMDTETETNGETTTTIQYIDWTGQDNKGNYEEGNWNNVTFNKNELRANETKHGGTYQYRLQKQ